MTAKADFSSEKTTLQAIIYSLFRLVLLLLLLLLPELLLALSPGVQSTGHQLACLQAAAAVEEEEEEEKVNSKLQLSVCPAKISRSSHDRKHCLA